MGNPLSPETIVYSIRAATDPRISPDGTTIVYPLASIDQQTKRPGSQLWVCDIDGGNARRITWSGNANGSPRWSPDGSQLLFLSDRNGRSSICLLPVLGGEARELLGYPGPVADLAWSPDGTHVVFTAPVDPDNPEGSPPVPGAAPPVRVTSRLDYKQDMRGWVNNTRMQVFILDVASGERRQLTNEANDHSMPAISPDGTAIAYSVGAGDNLRNRLVLQDLGSGEAREVIAPGRVSVFSWSPEGDRIIVASDPARLDLPTAGPARAAGLAG